MDCYGGIGFWTYLRLLATFSQLHEDLFELAATFCEAMRCFQEKPPVFPAYQLPTMPAFPLINTKG